MNFEIQKASVLKRISAFLLDLILLAVVATGFMLTVSLIADYDGHINRLDGYYQQYADKFGIESFDISQEQYDKLSQDERTRYDDAYRALLADEEAMHTYSMVTNLSLLITSLGIFFAYAVTEFVIPLIMKNGQTVGKKVFGLAVMRIDGVRANAFMLFVRTLIGKFTVETMIPVFLVLMNGIFGLTGIIVVGMLLVFEIVLLAATKNRTVIHDAFAQTVVVDLPSQMIFDTPEALLEYKTRLAAERAERAEYR